MPYKVIITDYKYPDIEQEKEVFEKSHLNIELLDLDGKINSPKDILEHSPDCDAIITQFTEIEEDLLNKLNDCKIIVRYAIGLDIIDLEAAKEQRIKVANVPDYCLDEVAEHSLSMILALLRKLKDTDRIVRETGEWSFKIAEPIKRISKTSLGLIAFGNIPQKLVDKVKPLNFQDIYVYDPYFDNMEDYPEVKFVDFEQLAANSDIISLHAPATEETKNLLDGEMIGQMKDGVYIVNTSRGALIDEDALYDGLKNGKISGAALDVLKEEGGNVKENPLLELENVIVSPHMAWYSEGARRELQRKAAEQVLKELKGDEPDYWVNRW